MDGVPRPVIAPQPEVVVDGAPWREVVRHGAPGDAFTHQIQDGIDDFTAIGACWTAARFGLRDMRLDALPLGVAQVTRV